MENRKILSVASELIKFAEEVLNIGDGGEIDVRKMIENLNVSVIYDDGEYLIVKVDKPHDLVELTKFSLWVAPSTISGASKLLGKGPVFVVFKNDEPYIYITRGTALWDDYEPEEFIYDDDPKLGDILLSLKDEINKYYGKYSPKEWDWLSSVISVSENPEAIRKAVGGGKNISENLRFCVTENFDTPPDVLEIIARTAETELVKKNLLNKGHVPPEALLVLAEDPNPEIRGKALRKLERLDSEELIEAYKRNPNNANIRRYVAGNENTPPEILAELAKDTDKDVRLAVAGNKNTPEKTLLELYYHDSDDEVKVKAKKTLRSKGAIKGRWIR